MKKYFERPSRLNSDEKPTVNDLSIETAPLVLVFSSLKTRCPSSSTPITMVYRTRCLYLRRLRSYRIFLYRGIAKAKVVWRLRKYWKIQLRMLLRGYYTLEGHPPLKETCRTHKHCGIVRYLDYPLSFECREHQLRVFFKNNEEAIEWIQATVNSYHAFEAANQ